MLYKIREVKVMKKITVGTGYRVSLTKALCEENHISEGDSYEVIVDNEGVITLYPCKEIESNDIKEIKFESEVLKKPINKNEEFVSNLDEGQNFYNKCYSECGLIIRTKKKYLKQYCERCRGQLLDNYTDGSYVCPYLKTIDSSDDILDSKNSDKVISPIIEDTSGTVNTVSDLKLKDVIRVEDKEQAKQNNKFLVDSINKHIEQLLQSLKVDIQNENDEEINVQSRANTSIEPVAYNHYHICDKCSKECQSGFILDKTMFLCKDCIKEDFIKYLKEIGKECNNV